MFKMKARENFKPQYIISGGENLSSNASKGDYRQTLFKLARVLLQIKISLYSLPVIKN